MQKRFRRVIFKKKKNFLFTNPTPLKKNYVYFFSKNKHSFIFRPQYDKFILFLKWFKRYQKDKTGLIFSFFMCYSPLFFCTKKPLGVRMGKGKGDLLHDFCNLHPGKFFLKVSNISPVFFQLFIKKLSSFFSFEIYYVQKFK